MEDDFDTIKILSQEEKEEILKSMNIKHAKGPSNHKNNR